MVFIMHNDGKYYMKIGKSDKFLAWFLLMKEKD